MSAAIASASIQGQDIMVSLRASFLESLGAVVNASDKPVVIYMDHQVSKLPTALHRVLTRIPIEIRRNKPDA